MSAEAGTDLSTGQAVPSLNTRGNDEFASLIGEAGGGGQQQQRTETTETKVAGTQERPPLETVTPKKAVGAEGQSQQGGDTTGQGTQQQQPAQSPGIDKAVLDQIVETATRAAAGASAAGQSKTDAQIKRDQDVLTPEQFNAKYQIEPVTEAHIQAILDSDPKKGAAMLNRLFMRNMGSAVLMARDIVDSQLKTVRAEMEPHVASWTQHQKEQREAKLETTFYTSNADLVNEKPLVKEMQDAIFGRIASGQLKPFNRPEDALKAVADATRAVLARMGRQTGAGGGGTVQQQSQSQGQGQKSPTRQMTAASTAGQSGSGQAAGQSDEEKIFGKDYV